MDGWPSYSTFWGGLSGHLLATMSLFNNLPSLDFNFFGVNASGHLTRQSQLWANGRLNDDEDVSDLFSFESEVPAERSFLQSINSRVSTLRNTAPDRPGCVSEGWNRTGGLNAFQRSILSLSQTNRCNRNMHEEVSKGDDDGLCPPKLNAIFNILRTELDRLPAGQLYKQSEVMKRAFSDPTVISSIFMQYRRYVENEIKRVRDEKYEARVRGVVCDAKHRVSLVFDFNPECDMCDGKEDATEHTCLPREKVITLIRSRIERWFSCLEDKIRRCQSRGQTAQNYIAKLNNVNFTRVKQVRSAQNKTNPMIGVSISSCEFSQDDAYELILKTMMSLDNSQNTGRKRRADRQLPVNFHTVEAILKHMKEYYLVNVDSSRDQIVDCVKAFASNATLDSKMLNGQMYYSRMSDDDREVKRRRMFEESERQRREAIEREFVNRDISQEDLARIDKAKLEEMWENVINVVPDCESFGGFELENDVANFGPLTKIVDSYPTDKCPINAFCAHLKDRSEEIAMKNNVEARVSILRFWGDNYNSVFQDMILDRLKESDLVSAQTIVLARSYYFWQLHHTRVATWKQYVCEHIKECKLNNVW